MGFRFRRAIKLLPGLRLNFGLRGASVSLGVPGAVINFSERGARTTFGIPGTGFSWSTTISSGRIPERYRSPRGSGDTRPIETLAELEAAVRDPSSTVVYRGSGRRLSPQQLDAAHRRLANQERKQRVQAEIDRLDAELVEQLNSWRDLPSLPTPAEYEAALTPQPFVQSARPPAAPDLERAHQQLKATMHVEAETSMPPISTVVPLLVAAIGVLAAAVIGYAGPNLVGASLAASLGVAATVLLTAVVAALLVHRGRVYRRASSIDAEAASRVEAAWPDCAAKLAASHASSVADYERTRAAAEAAWMEAEHARIVWAGRLVSGEVEAVHAAVSDTLEDLDFPFETSAEFAVETAEEGYLHVDLPEIEDVVPATRHRVLSDGRMKEVKRDEAERNEQYGELVCGVGLMVAAAAFAAAPTMSLLHLAAYSQREQKGKNKGTISDDYLYVASINRGALQNLHPESVNPTAFMMRTGRMEQQANLRLRKLPAKDLPTWVAELDG